MRMPMQGSCHFVVCTTFSLALPCHEPYYLHLPDTRLTFFGTFFAFCPADPVGYLSHVLRLHRERELLDTVPVSLYLYLYLYLLLYIHLSIQILCIRERHVNFPRVRYPYPIPLSIYLSTLPSLFC